MASVIAAGTTSGTSLNLSADTSGVLQLATNGTTTAVTIDTSQNVGIGTASPATKAEISGTAAASNLALRITNTATDGYSTLQLGDANAGVYRNGSAQSGYAGASSLNLITVGAHNIGFSTQNTLRAVIDSSGNVGIGTSSPLTPLHVVGAIQSQRSGAAQYARMVNSAGTATFISDNQASATYTGFQFQGLSTASGTPVSYATINANGIGLGTAVPSSGIGITFPATQSASSDANTLDDYEEGTWTPTISIGGSTTGITYSNQVGRYTKIGNMVYISGYLSLASNGGLTGSVNLNGFPFSTANISNLFHAPAFGWYTGVTGITAGIGLDIAPNTTGAPMVYFTNTTALTLGHAQITNTFAIEWTFAYRTA